MWSSKRAARNTLVSLALLAPVLAVAGCTGLTPVYSDAALSQKKFAFNFAAPASRLDQIAYQELALRFPNAGPDAPTLTVSVSAGGRQLTRSATRNPITNYEAIAYGTVTIVDRDGRQLFSAVRNASASYQTNGQVFADTEAFNAAAAQATRSVAESLRLAILAGYPAAIPQRPAK